MNVLSLFDGISTGFVAFKKLNIPVENYYAYEINKRSILIAEKNHPEIIECGDVLDADFSQYKGHIDIIIGGSPCKNFSRLGDNRGLSGLLEYEFYIQEKEKYGKDIVDLYGQSCLFWEYIRALKEVQPKYFLLENVKMNSRWVDLISSELGVKPISINSKLVSAQNRDRLYWTNIPNVSVPVDKCIYLDDVVGNDLVKAVETPLFRMSIDFIRDKFGYIPRCFNPKNEYEILLKSPCLTTSTGIYTTNSIVYYIDGQFLVPDIVVWERLQTLPDGYTEDISLTVAQRKKLLGDAWTVDVIVEILKNIDKAG